MERYGAPSPKLLFEEWRILPNWVHGRFVEDGLARQYRGDGRSVVVLPGMLTSDARTRMLRRVLEKAGYDVHGWGLGHNMPHRVGLVISMLRERLAGFDRPVTLIGWSLGGLIAREYAKVWPDDVDQVITMGSPFSGNPRANNAWRAYELFAGHKVDNPPFEGELATKPPMHTTAIWSGHDGVIAPDAARGMPGERDAEIEIGCGHFAMSCAPDALTAVLTALQAQQKKG